MKWFVAAALQVVLAGAALSGSDAASAEETRPSLPLDAFERAVALDSQGSRVDRLALDLMMGRVGAEAELAAAIAGGSLNHAEQSVAWESLCGHRFRQQRYSEAAAACSAAEALVPGSGAQAAAIAHMAQNVRPVTWSAASVRIPLRDGRAGVTRNGVSVDAVLDTGAEIAVVMESVARQLQAQPLAGEATVGTSTEPVAGGLVVISGLEIGGATLNNVVAVVLPDAQLTFGDIRMPLILSLPAFTSLGRAAFMDHGAMLVLGRDAPVPGSNSAPLYWDESGVGFGADFSNGRRGVQFDTGANESFLLPASRSALSANELATAEEVELGFAGLGGVQTQQGLRLRDVVMRVGPAEWRLDTIDVAANDVNGEAARIGRDLFTRFETVVLDFQTMRMTVSG